MINPGLSSRGSTEAVDLSYEGTTTEILSAYLSNSNSGRDEEQRVVGDGEEYEPAGQRGGRGAAARGGAATGGARA